MSSPDLSLAPTPQERRTRGRVCPKCSYARQPGDTAPAWQCPRCGIVYDKYLSSAEADRAAERAVERRHKPEVEVVDRSRRWPWVVAAVVIAAGGWGAWQWQAKRQKASPEALARLSKVEQARTAEQVELDLKVAWEVMRPSNRAQAMEVFNRYAGKGNTRALALAGMAYGRPEHAKRMEGLRKAADEGEAVAFVNLGFIYETGDGESRNMDQAANWYSKAARQGDSTGLYALGRLIASGAPGIERNPRQAWLLLEMADRAFTAGGSKRDFAMPYERSAFHARADQQALEKELSPVDIVKGRELADAWKAGQPLPAMP